MARSIGEAIEAVREVFVNNKYQMSRSFYAFDTTTSMSMDRQFWFEVPAATRLDHVHKRTYETHTWVIHICMIPKTVTRDVDFGIGEMADRIGELVEALLSDSTVINEPFRVVSTDPIFNEENQFLELVMVCELDSTRVYA